MEYVITGGAGYIGGHLTDFLVNEGKSAIVLDDMSTGVHINKKAQMHKIDLRKPVEIKLPSGATIIHMAANAEVKGSMLDARRSFERNVTATFNILEAARKTDAQTILFTSSSTVYGNAELTPTPESYEKKPVSNYGTFKLMSEQMIESYATNYGIRSVALRFANVTGGRVTHGIVKNWQDLIKAGKPVETWGSGENRKNYVYYTEVIEAVLSSIEKAKPGFTAYNVGGEGTTSANEMYSMITNELGLKIKCNRIAAQEGDVRFMLLDTKKIEKEIGWKAKMNSKEAVLQTLKEALLPS